MIEEQQMRNVGGTVVDPDDPLLIAQSLTYITDNGSVVLTFQAAPYSFSFKLRFIILEAIFLLLLIAAVPINAHGTIVAISIGNLTVIAWFWYNSVRTVEITTDGSLRFWIGNMEIDVPFDKIIELRRVAGECSIVSPSLQPHRGFLTQPTDGVAIITSVPSTPFFMWPRSAGRPERRLGPFTCPRLKVVFSPAGGGLNFIREVENEMNGMRGDGGGLNENRGHMQQPPAFDNKKADGTGEFFDV
mmetsp:Transcript_5675/g.8229  ORF Transcript_5675/g.8229 Transcript_5675/m.8229 type:complete len:245 (+) Transcript_5675:108-842(+)|eukprot:CAMPEP_0184855644 /NCGR_PEP_ID=MMETSP0580-20130426/822_1 /TAXON_ID=1118495 /ORGANISM="Dactyliosolen fragilissimus" /LENGTH=244 /DNA_ID=CAMNT_0027350207 /DNA_START=136 /DNA_END=870 /DNA_ORIENTATION=-